MLRRQLRIIQEGKGRGSREDAASQQDKVVQSVVEPRPHRQEERVSRSQGWSDDEHKEARPHSSASDLQNRHNSPVRAKSMALTLRNGDMGGGSRDEWSDEEWEEPTNKASNSDSHHAATKSKGLTFRKSGKTSGGEDDWAAGGAARPRLVGCSRLGCRQPFQEDGVGQT